MALYKIICHTEGCENENIEIEFATPSDSMMCHPCGQLFTDVTVLDPNRAVMLPDGTYVE